MSYIVVQQYHWHMVVQGWGLLSQFSPFRYFPNFSASPKYMLAIVYRVHIWQVLPQLSCGDTCQIWMWCKWSNRYFDRIENFAYGEINERSFCNPHPRSTEWSWFRKSFDADLANWWSINSLTHLCVTGPSWVTQMPVTSYINFNWWISITCVFRAKLSERNLNIESRTDRSFARSLINSNYPRRTWYSRLLSSAENVIFAYLLMPWKKKYHIFI